MSPVPETYDALVETFVSIPNENMGAGFRVRMSGRSWMQITSIRDPRGHCVAQAVGPTEKRTLMGFGVALDHTVSGLVLERFCPGVGNVPTEETPQKCWWCGAELAPVQYIGVRRDRPLPPLQATLDSRHVRIPPHYFDARLTPRPTGIRTLRAAVDG